jgi:hypothetical protein
MRPVWVGIALLLAGSAVPHAAGPLAAQSDCIVAPVAPSAHALAPNSIWLRIENRYVAWQDLGGLGTGQRCGTDIAEGTLVLQSDNSWKGEVEASVSMKQMLKGLGMECPEAPSKGKQSMRVTATRVTGFGPSLRISYRSGTADGGYLALVFEPKEAPRFDKRGDCLDLYRREWGAHEFLPLNDTRWTGTEAGSVIVIGLPASGVLEYEDLTLADLEGPIDRGDSPLPWKGTSKWKIRVERP